MFRVDIIGIPLADKMPETVLDLASKDQEPTIIIGDFNVDPQRDSTKYEGLKQG